MTFHPKLILSTFIVIQACYSVIMNSRLQENSMFRYKDQHVEFLAFWYHLFTVYSQMFDLDKNIMIPTVRFPVRLKHMLYM